MTVSVQRTCTEIHKHGSPDDSQGASRSFDEYVETEAYVLLGAPGGGKTEEFLRQAKLAGGCYVTARNFMTFPDRPEWHNTTLFIDGLDEARVRSGDGHTPLDEIRTKLDYLGCPRFRLSCRDADWFGANDVEHLTMVSPDGKIAVLRLDPLSGENIREILASYRHVEDTEEFLYSAHNNGVDPLLTNPKTLEMLAETVADGNWPETRTQTFELSCRRALLKEHNEQHRIALANGANTGSLMRIAGRLCAMQLLTGRRAFTMHGDATRTGDLGIEMVGGQDRHVLRQVLDSKLFAAPTDTDPGEGAASSIAPVHSQIAEFLAGRYLAGLVRDGLPTARILALMTGHDGFIVSDLRGLSAWLAAHSKPSRMEIIARDPLGTVLYGDVREFSSDEKQAVMDGLESEAKRNPWFAVAIKSNSSLGDLVAPDMESTFHEVLCASSRDTARQAYVDIVFEMLVHGQPLPNLADVLLRVVQDSTWWPRIKHSAVTAFSRHRDDKVKALAELKAVLDDVYVERVSDPNDDLLGHLLITLYPGTLSASDVLDYLRVSKQPGRCPRYEYFWTGHLPKKSTCGQLARLLDGLAVRRDALLDELQQHARPVLFLRRMPLVILERFIELSTEPIEPDRLFDWLGVARWVGDWGNGTRGKPSARIEAWLNRRPELWKALFEMSLQRCAGVPECTDMTGFNRCMYMEKTRRLLGIHRSPDFGTWCLEQATATENRTAATWLMGQVAATVHSSSSNENLSRESVETRISDRTVLKNAFTERLSALEESDASREPLNVDVQYEEPDQSEWRDAVTQNLAALRENRGDPAFLHRFAEAYFEEFADVVGDTPQDRLRSLLGNDKKLIDAVLDGFRGTIRRDDLPTDEELIRLGSQHRVHYLALPFMAGLEEIFQAAPDNDLPLDDARLRSAIAIHYDSRIPLRSRGQTGEPQDWFSRVLRSQPETVAGVLVRTARAMLGSGVDFAHHLHALAHSPDHAAVARLASLQLLSAFPVRCTERQLPSLDYLLHAARLHCESEPFRRLTERKLSSRSMNMAQRVYWLAAGLLTWQGPYLDKLESYVAGNERRVRHLSRFIAQAGDRPHTSISKLDAPAITVLIRVIGASCRPHALDRDPQTWTMSAAFRITDLINALAAIPSATVSRTLNDLAADERLRAWHPRLNDAAHRQNAIRREASFRHRDVEKVIEVLDMGKPANAAGLAALVLEFLREIGRTIRDGATSDWRQYWNTDSQKQPSTPKHEDLCRDTLLSDLRYRLEPLNIDAQPEGRYADDKRSDICVALGGFNVPVEIKKSCHRELWSAIRTQLIARYARDPGADGHGIYLVFWFGDTDSCRPTPGEGTPPRSAVELEQGLRETLSVEEQLKISICVIDVSMPAAR